MMADIYQDLLDSGLTKDQAWRRSFYVPAVLLVVVAAAVYFLGQDTPKVRQAQPFMEGSSVGGRASPLTPPPLSSEATL